MEQGNIDEIEEVERVITPDILGKSIKEAKKILKESGLECVIEVDTEDEENTYVKEQIPNAGITVNKGSKIYIK